MVTLDDVPEATVGDISSRDELANLEAVQREDGSWVLDGLLTIGESKEIFYLQKLSKGEEVNYHTVGGFVVFQMGQARNAGRGG